MLGVSRAKTLAMADLQALLPDIGLQGFGVEGDFDNVDSLSKV